ncbi:hypothetical protein [Clostridium rectalis]|uniref:hypothetical protein n=1 Tax=Clostridium rectalis TaxID=2040295 RepID=UPI000F637032|nr:hypothetical protein [Clostridium rectalis]
MKKKIKNKNGFLSGIIFLSLAIVSFILLMENYSNMVFVKTIKNSLLSIFCLILGVSELYKSLVILPSEDEQINDEREKMISLKAKNSAFKITLGFCITVCIVLAIAIKITNYTDFIGVFIGIFIVSTIMFLSVIGAYFYHDKHN